MDSVFPLFMHVSNKDTKRRSDRKRKAESSEEHKVTRLFPGHNAAESFANKCISQMSNQDHQNLYGMHGGLNKQERRENKACLQGVCVQGLWAPPFV